MIFGNKTTFIALVAIFGFALTFTFSCSGGDDGGGGNSSGGSSCDMSGYKSKKMPDGKTWMTENLNCKVAGSECYDKNESNCNTYGRLYTWEAAKKACSGGWRLPSDAEWDALVAAVGGASTAGTKLKARDGWNSYSGVPSGTDDFGFSALPGGFGNSDGSFYDVGDGGLWWSSTKYDSHYAYSRYMYYYDEYVSRFNGDKDFLFSVRCLQD